MILTRLQRPRPPRQQPFKVCTYAQPIRRGKAFVKRSDPNGEVFYTPKKGRLGNTKRRDIYSEDPFFLSPPVVLDLVEEGRRGVRDFNVRDEDLLADMYFYTPEMKAAQARVGAFTAEILEQRRKAGWLSKERVYMTSIRDSDILAAAVLGISEKGMSPDSRSQDKENSSEAPTRSNNNDPRATIRKIIRLNGLPERAAANDRSLLEWMILRKRSIAEKQLVVPQAKQRLELALVKCRSIEDMRRIIFLYLDAGMDMSSEKDIINYFGSQIFDVISDTCLNVLRNIRLGSPKLIEALVFINNLRIRVFQGKKKDTPSCLDGLALRISAAAGLFERTAAEIQLLHDSEGLEYNSALEDVYAALGFCLSHVKNDPSVSQDSDKYDSLKILMGLQSPSGSERGSFRTVLMRCFAKFGTRPLILDTYTALLSHVIEVMVAREELPIALEVFRVGSMSELLEKSREEFTHLSNS